MKATLSHSDIDKSLLTAELWAQLIEAAPGLEWPDWATEVDPTRELDQSQEWRRNYWSIEGLCVTSELAALTKLGFAKFQVSRVRGLFSEREPRHILADAASGAAGIVNIDIHVPGSVSLMTVQTVHWLEDACTQDLQRWMNDGWRIIAVCPPNDTRRPTYIIGHERAHKGSP